MKWGVKPQRVIRVSFGWVNLFLIKGRKTIIVDAGPPYVGKRILRILTRYGIKREEISLIILTHAHFDHFGGALSLKQALSIPLAVHKADAIYLEKGENAPIVPLGFPGKFLKACFRKWMKERISLSHEILLEEKFDLNNFGVDGYVLHTPGHTQGSVSVILNDEAIVGDLLAPHPLFRWRPNLPLFAQEKKKLLKSIKTLLSLGIKKFHSAHGGPWSREEIKKWIFYARVA